MLLGTRRKVVLDGPMLFAGLLVSELVLDGWPEGQRDQPHRPSA